MLKTMGLVIKVYARFQDIAIIKFLKMNFNMNNLMLISMRIIFSLPLKTNQNSVSQNRTNVSSKVTIYRLVHFDQFFIEP